MIGILFTLSHDFPNFNAVNILGVTKHLLLLINDSVKLNSKIFNMEYICTDISHNNVFILPLISF